MTDDSIRHYWFCKLIGAGVSERQKERLILEYCNADWDSAIEYFKMLRHKANSCNSSKAKITPLSIRLAKKIRADVGIDVFPIIDKTYAGKWLKGDGAFLWVMLMLGNCGAEQSQLGSGSPATECARSDSKLSLYTGWRDYEIVLNDGREKNIGNRTNESHQSRNASLQSKAERSNANDSVGG